ncbi:MAG: DUF6553 family protein [Lachnospiraceae bacterium]
MDEKELTRYMNAWVMLKASSCAGLHFFTRKKARKDALTYLSVFQPHDQNENHLQNLQDFARELITASLQSRSYGSTLFGMVPMREKDVAQKLAAEIRSVTLEYPAKLHLEEDFAFLYQVMKDVFFELVPDAKQVWPD